MIDISKTDTSTTIHIILILIAHNNRVIFFIKPSLRNLNPAFIFIVLSLHYLSIDIKHVDLFACEIYMSIRDLLLVVEVETHLHEAIVDFAWV